MTALTDAFGRTHRYLRISVTDRCNLRCRYCMPAPGIAVRPKSELLTFDEIERVVRVTAAMGVRKVRLTGGELLRRDLPRLVEQLRRVQGIDTLGMTTNGILLSRFARFGTCGRPGPINRFIPTKDVPMTDPRIDRLAQVMVHYSLELKPAQKLVIVSTPLAEELVNAVYRQAIMAGAHVHTDIRLPLLQEIFFKHASDEQLDFVPPIDALVMKEFDAVLSIMADTNIKRLSGIDPERIARTRRASAGMMKIFHERAARMEIRWCVTLYPTYSAAQDAEMGLEDYREFVYGAGMLNEADPVAFWKAEGERQRALCN